MLIVDTQFGFFQALFQWMRDRGKTPPEWLADSEKAVALDFAYHTHSGAKPVAPLVAVLVDSEGVLSLANAKRIAGIFWSIQGANLARIWENFTAEYNPIENYSMTEQSTDENSGTTSTTTGGTETGNGSGTTSGKLYGFDSAAAVNRDETTTTNTDTTTRTGTESGEHETTNTHTLTRSGNIGVTTSAQMIAENLKLFGESNFYMNYLFPMVDMILTIPIY